MKVNPLKVRETETALGRFPYKTIGGLIGSEICLSVSNLLKKHSNKNI